MKPLIPSSADDVLSQLPERAGEILGAPEQLKHRIEQRIRELGSGTADALPEETLALLASATAAHSQILSPSRLRGSAPLSLWVMLAVGGLAVLATAVFWAVR